MLRKPMIAALAGVVALGLGLVLALALLIDVNAYRGAVSERLTLATGRAVDIEGELSLAWGWPPELRLGGLRIANAAWGSAADMLWIDQAAAEVALWPLLRGEVRIRRLFLDGIVLLLERDSEGRANWIFETEPARGSGTQARARPLPELGEVRVRDLAFRWRDAVGGNDEALRLHHFELRADDREGFDQVAFALDYRGEELSGRGKVGSLEVLPASGSWPLDLDLRWGEAALGLRGQLELPQLTAFDLRLLAEAPDLAWIGRRFDLELPMLPLTLAARFHGGLQQYHLDDLSVTLGESDLAGSVHGGANAAPGLHLRSRRLDLDAWRQSRPDEGQAAPLFSPELWPPTLLPAVGMPFSWAVDHLSLGGFSLSALRIEGSLRPDRSVAASLKALWADGRLAADVELSEQGEGDGLGLLAEATLVESSLGQLMQQAWQARDVDVSVDATLSARASGRSAAEFARSLDGHLSLSGGRGRIHHRALGALSSDLLGTLMPFIEEQDSAALNCLAGRFDFEAGVAEDGMLLFDSETLTLAGRGRVDLGAESVAGLLTPRPKRAGLMNLAVPMEVVGPLSQPEIRPEGGALLRRSAGVALAAVNPLVLLVPVVTTALSGPENPCFAALEEARTGERGAESESRVEGFMRGLRRFLSDDG